MSALPDLRLQATPEVKSKAKQPAKALEPSKNGASSFAEVYAKERQAKPGERAGSTDKTSQEQKSAPSAGEPDAASTAAEQPAVAAPGNSLPTQENAAEELDPLLAMALGGIQAQVDDAPLTEESSALPVLVITGASSDVAENTEPVLEEALDPLALLKQPAEEAIKAQAPQDAAIKSARVATSTDFAAAMAAMGKGEESGESTEEPTLDLPLESLPKDALESLKDSAQPTRPDQFVSKLNSLTQALNHQAGAAQRLPLVPGQPVAMQQGGWSEAVVDRVMWLSSHNLKSAEIQLDPADLGRLEVRVNLSQDQAQVTFASPNAGVREALEGQMHRLRELFAQQGMNLADANVSDQSLNRGWQGQGEDGRGGSGSRDDLLASDELQPGVRQDVRSERLTSGRGLVDYYA
ncbi:flagellar hook-length control protein FliK [Ectopseudomonas oleovorans]|uniref:Flagellar hook-length control protein FliK n=1 Tax=Ectopseudomonas oleovorans TaxID=301 RepID=A0A3R8XJP9_ECTOL|nr:flagellar hook-length control protein FliK [Pseudomonas oleovorans]RRW38439.1 flagellar hook-length control protein FliK [Pseudomonas oleovorans]